MENTEKIVLTQEQLEDTVAKAVTAREEEFKKTLNPFTQGHGGFVIADEKSVKPNLGNFIVAEVATKHFNVSKDVALKELYKNAKTIEERMSWKTMQESDFASGGNLLIPEVSTQFIDLLRPLSSMRQTGLNEIKMNNFELLINRETSGVGGGWVGEIPVIPTKGELKLGQYNLTPKFYTAWTTISKMLMLDAPQAMQILTNDLTLQIAIQQDLAMLFGTGNTHQPLGIYGWTTAANLFDSTGTTAELIDADLNKAEFNITGKNVLAPRGLVWVMSSAAFFTLQSKYWAVQGLPAFPGLRDPKPTLHGKPVYIDNNIASDGGTGTNESKILLFAPEHYIIGDRLNLQIEVNPSQNDPNMPYTYQENLVVANIAMDTCLKYGYAASWIEKFVCNV